MRLARVLIVDDSIVARRLVREIIEEDPDLQVAGVASTAPQALAKVAQLQPDFVVLDVEMPDMTGLQALPHLRRLCPEARIIMFSAQTARGAAATFDALSLGASDYVTKPATTAGWDDAKDRVRAELVSKIKALFRRAHASALDRRSASTTLPQPPAHPVLQPSPIDIVGIGASTGGPNALAEVLAGLGSTCPVPVVIVQHMPPVFTRMLAERLAARTGGYAVEARDGDEVRPGGVWVAPGDHHMTVVREGTRVILRLNQSPPENFCRPSVDVLFRSLAAVYGAHTLAVVLTGMGTDGYRGACDIVAAGGQVMAQDRETSVVWGMPGHLAQTGVADEIVPLPRMASRILHRIRQSADATPVRGTRAV